MALGRGRRRAKPIGEYPVSKRDVSLVTPAEASYSDIEKCLVNVGGAWLESTRVFDVYTGDALPEGTRAIGVRLTFRSPERTLTDGDVDPIVEKAVQKLQSDLGVRLRG